MTDPLKTSADAAAREMDGIPEPNDAVWLAERRKSIGASEAAAVLGEDKRKSPFAVWAEKTGKAEPPNLDEVEEVFWGNELEATICNVFARRTGRHVTHNPHHELTRHPDHLFMHATLDATQTWIADGDVADKRIGFGVLQAKNVGYFPGLDWKEKPPLAFQIQVQHEIACTGLNWGTLVALVGGNRLIWYDMERNERFIAAMIEREAFFWTQVIDGIPPEPDGSEATTAVLKRLYPKDDGEIIALPEDATGWDARLQAAKAEIKSFEAEKRKAENQLKHALGTATTGVLPNGDQYQYKNEPKKAYSVKAQNNRVLRRKAAR